MGGVEIYPWDKNDILVTQMRKTGELRGINLSPVNFRFDSW